MLVSRINGLLWPLQQWLSDLKNFPSLHLNVHQQWCLNITYTLEDCKIGDFIHQKYAQLGFHQAPHQLRRECEHPRKNQRIRMSKERVYSWFSSCPELFSFTLLTGKDVRIATQGAVRKWLVPICSLLFFTKHMHCCHTAVWLTSILWYIQCTQIGCLGGSRAELDHCQSKTAAHQKEMLPLMQERCWSCSFNWMWSQGNISSPNTTHTTHLCLKIVSWKWGLP